ncbi:MAG: OmpA family protein, partial [Pseudomonadota bacterium]|nr:OmpA family protein [Pseudomonadota bacterium]
TGEYLDGYTVQMINADTGMAASVYGDDGVSSYPATVVSGSAVTDSGGNVYNYGTGEYRFPFAPAGNYKLVVTAPSGAKYSWPSTKATELIYQLPLEHRAITLGSRGETFPLLPGPPLHIDIPVDPLTSQLYIQRSANQASVAAGDFIRYSISLENITAVTLNDVVLSETLPRGFRLQKGSVVIDGNRSSDPLISADGATLNFDFGAMATGATKQIEYVSAIGAVQPGIATSSSYARANSGAAESNRATHDARIFDELMRGRALLMGQIIIDATDDEPLPSSGIKGVRLYMEDGRYAVSDEQGKFHFDNVTPGSHVVQLDLDTLPDHYEVVMGDQNSRFAGRAWSQFVDLQGGTLWRTDFHVARKPTPTGNLSLQISNATPQENGDIPYQIDLQTDTVGVSNLRLTLMIPASTDYLPGSSRFGGNTISDPDIVGNVLTYRLGDSDNSADWRSSLNLTLHSNSDKSGATELITKASLLYDTPAKQNQRLPLANHMFVLIAEQAKQEAILEEFVIVEKFLPSGTALKENDKEQLQQIANTLAQYQNIRIHAIGHSDSLPILRQKNLAKFANNQVLSEQRAQEVANYLRDLLRLPPDQITIEGKGAEQPIASDTSAAGRAANRRVQLYIYRDTAIGSDRISGTAASSEPQTSTIKGHTPGALVTPAATAANPEPPPSYNSEWLAQQNSEIDWLLPQPNSLPAIPTTDIAIKHSRDQSISLTLNGIPVAAMNFNGTLRNNTGAAVSNWSGVDLAEGDNLFNVTLSNAQGQVVQQLSRNVHYSGAPVRAEIVVEQSVLIADSITQPVIAVRLYDKDNYPIHAGMEIEYSINAPFQLARNSDFVTDNMAGAPGKRHYATADKNGVVLITLQATNSTDDLILMLPLANNKTVELKSRLKAKARDWILIGMAEGSAGFNTLSGNLEGVEGSAAQDHLYRDDRIAFFAKGQVLGKWLLTMAYDTDSGKDQSQKKGNDPQLFQAIDPGSYYTVYGDAGQNGFDAASSNKLYLKLERDEFYLLFGDYQTNLNDTKLARYDRTLTGIKSRYQDEKYDLMLFVSESNQAFVKDELRGQGSTGPYKVSRSNIALNTEIVTIEARDRFRSDVIVSSKTLARHSDYDINYLEGNITFREPLFSTDANLNPQYIVIRYEAYDESDVTITSGGRAEVKVNDKLKVGLSQVSEGRSGGDALLGAADLQYQISDTTTLRLEAARSLDSKESASSRDGNAYLAEVEHQTGTQAGITEFDFTLGFAKVARGMGGAILLAV